METFYIMLWFTLGYASNNLYRLIKKALTEHVWDCPHCTLVLRTNNKEALLAMKTDHIRRHLQ